MSSQFKIEAGKRYHRADGGLSGMIERTGDNGAYEFTDGTRYYDRCGFLYSAKDPSKVDLIREHITIKYGTHDSDVIIERLRDQQTKFMTPILGEAANALDASGERIAELEAVLEKLACLGNGKFYGSSEGNRIAQGALNSLETSELKTGLATARNEALEEALNIIREHTPTMPPDGPETSEHQWADECMGSVFSAVEALKTNGND